MLKMFEMNANTTDLEFRRSVFILCWTLDNSFILYWYLLGFFWLQYVKNPSYKKMIFVVSFFFTVSLCLYIEVWYISLNRYLNYDLLSFGLENSSAHDIFPTFILWSYMRWYLFVTFRHGVNGHKLDTRTH